MNKKFYLTTAIAYTSAVPHIGNVYEAILADSICRYKRFKGYDVYFQTGTDEHGQKIQEKAQAAGVTPQAFVDNVAGEIKQIWDSMGTSYDKFIRTTDADHVAQVAKINDKNYAVYSLIAAIFAFLQILFACLLTLKANKVAAREEVDAYIGELGKDEYVEVYPYDGKPVQGIYVAEIAEEPAPEAAPAVEEATQPAETTEEAPVEETPVEETAEATESTE